MVTQIGDFKHFYSEIKMSAKFPIQVGPIPQFVSSIVLQCMFLFQALSLYI